MNIKMSGSINTLERMKKSGEVKESFLLSGKTEGIESSLGENESWDSVYKPTTVTLKYESHPGMGKYVNSLKHLLPVRVKTGPGSYMPVDMTGCYAFSFFSWLTPLVWRTFRRGLTESDLYHCSPLDSCQVNGARFSQIWSKEIKNKGLQKASLSHSLFRFMRTRYLVACFMYILCVAFGFIGPTVFMRLLLEYIQKPADEELIGITWMICLIFSEAIRITFFSLLWAINIRTAVRASSAISALLYKKITSLRSISHSSSGELVNLFSNDCRKVFTMVYNFPLIIDGPLVIIGAIIFTWWLLGPFCFVGVAVFLLAYALQFVISYVSAHYQKKTVKTTDERVSLMSEFLSNVKIVKFHAWEKHLIENVRAARAKERSLLQKVQYLHTINSSVSSLSAVIATIFTILAYTLFGYDITPAEAFTLVMVNTIASHGIRTLPTCIRNIVNGMVAISRLQALLQLEEKENYTVVPNRLDIAINVSNATLTWEQMIPNISQKGLKSKKGEVNLIIAENEKNVPEEISPKTALVSTLQSETGLPPVLTDISFSLLKGKLIGVCGPYGSGKSSLISALLGQMRLIKGQIAVSGSIAYAAQQPWILNATLRENILFGQLFSSKRYYEAVYCCGLHDDIATLPGGDQTELSEQGINLSGGQKQRISLARALYADKDLYLLDDPLSAVDSQVGRHIFQHCIKGALKDKSILLVTHQLQYLEECDSIIYMRDGTIVEQGTHDELMKKDSEYASLIRLLPSNENLKQDTSNFNDNTEIYIPAHDYKKSSVLSSATDLYCSEGQLSTEEKTESGSISYNTYVGYIEAAGGFIVCALVLVWFLIQSATAAFSKYWLSVWLSEGDGNHTFESIPEPEAVADIQEYKLPSITNHPDIEFFQLVYGLSVAAMLVASLILGYLFTKTSLRASSSLHDKMLQKVFRSPMHFFDTTPTGRILNVFTHDTDEVDTNVPMTMVSLLQKISAVLFALLIVMVVYYWFVIPLLLLGALFFFLQKMFKVTMRDLKRFENISRSPIFSHVRATAQGLSTIRAFQKQDDFFDRFTQLVDQHTSPCYLYYCSMRWLGIRMDFLCLLIALITSLFVIFFRDDVNPAFSALALVLVLQLSNMYQFIVRLGCDLEAKFTSVERIQTYAEELDLEAAPVIEKTRPSPDWPTRGRISFNDVKLRYRPSLPLALNGLTFSIEPQEKIGIVGKTGSGKSSLGAALFRVVELTSGSIVIDGINIDELGLEDLRSRMSAIPQDPVLFQGTVRYNLDPLNEFEDEILWKVLSEVDMKSKISSLEGGLEAYIVEGGNNFSVGEKQLLCMARALLHQSKVVLLDEATASLDSETDKIIQKVLREVFSNSTVLIIAHRLTTVANCDRVMVLSEGKVVEFDQPTLLLANPKSHFSQLMAMSRSSINL